MNILQLNNIKYLTKPLQLLFLYSLCTAISFVFKCSIVHQLFSYIFGLESLLFRCISGFSLASLSVVIDMLICHVYLSILNKYSYTKYKTIFERLRFDKTLRFSLNISYAATIVVYTGLSNSLSSSLVALIIFCAKSYADAGLVVQKICTETYLYELNIETSKTEKISGLTYLLYRLQLYLVYFITYTGMLYHMILYLYGKHKFSVNYVILIFLEFCIVYVRRMLILDTRLKKHGPYNSARFLHRLTIVSSFIDSFLQYFDKTNINDMQFLFLIFIKVIFPRINLSRYFNKN